MIKQVKMLLYIFYKLLSIQLLHSIKGITCKHFFYFLILFLILEKDK